LSSVPAEREDEFHTSVYVGEDEVQDEISGDADVKSCFAIIY
jgi:hypothetical protein